jgi:hypothetical protein
VCGNLLLRESSLEFLLLKLLIGLKKKGLYPYFLLNKYLKFSYKYLKRQLNKNLAIFSKDFRSKVTQGLSSPDDFIILNKIGELSMYGLFNCLGFGLVKISGKDAWHTDCIHHYHWPLHYFSRIDFIKSTVHCDVKIVWEKSRLQYLLSLAILNSTQPSTTIYLEKLKEIIFSWIKENPCGFGPNWVSAMEVAIRGVNLLIIYTLVQQDLSIKQKNSMLHALAEHHFFLRHFPEKSDVSGNHYLATEMGLFILGLFISNTKDECDILLNKFLSVSQEQFTTDGLHIEFSPTYHLLCLEMIAIAYSFAQYFKLNNTNKLYSLLCKANHISTMLADSKGRLPLFSDNDSGKILDLGQDSRYINHFSKADGLFLKLLNCISPLSFAGQDSNTTSSQYIKPFGMLISKNAKLVYRCGEHGLLGRAAHDHDDNLSFWFTAFDHEIIIEAGSAPYTLNAKHREETISSTSHNVITAKGKVRFIPQSGSIYKTVRGAAIANLINSDANQAIALLESKNEAAYQGCPTFNSRKFILNDLDNEIILTIADTFSLKPGEKYFSSWLHLSENQSELEQIDTNSFKCETDSLLCQLKINSDQDCEYQLEQYEYMPSYGEKRLSKRLHISGQAFDYMDLVITLKIQRKIDPKVRMTSIG